MKFKKLSLDESLFDDSADWFSELGDSATSSVYDDEFVGADLPTNMLNGPRSGSDSGVADLLISAINDEWKTISTYNSIIETLKYESKNNEEYLSFITVLNDINAEENKHVGQLQEVLRRISPNAQYIDEGRLEGRSQFKFTNGQLPVQSWSTESSASCSSANCGDDVCTLTDVDDDM